MTQLLTLSLKPRVVTREQLAVLSLACFGAGTFAASLLADPVLGGEPGIGTMQKLLLVLAASAWIAAAGLNLATHHLRAPSWLAQNVTVHPAAALMFAGIATQLAALTLVARAFEIDSSAFYDKILTLTLLGFILHHVMPRRMQLVFFAGLSLSGIIWVFGLEAGAWLIALGAVLISLCHLPLGFRTRIALLIGSGILLGLLRAGRIEAPWPAAIWPILGSMFMFRLVAYMYDLKHSKEPPNLTRATAYFFLLPNIVFPLFPVVDYATFRRTYFDRNALVIYQRGIRWMTIGITHLLLYRLVYQKLTLSPAEVTGFASGLQYMIANFGLYLRVSGQFHIIVGMLHLYGFRLPETHRFYFLASSFTDFWRRINIYWKDFMMKVVYYPVYFRVRRWRDTAALIVATLVVFVVTWATHSYQWFWLLGHVLFSATDALFWGILAALLVFNTLREARKGRRRTIGVARHGWRTSLGLAGRIVATFAVMCLLWSLWTSPNVAEWFALIYDARPNASDLLLLIMVSAGCVLLLASGDQLLVRRGQPIRAAEAVPSFTRQFAFSSGAIVMLYLLATPGLTTRLTRLTPHTAQLLSDMRTGELNRADRKLMQRGYYENLTGVNQFNSQLWQVYANYRAPKNWEFAEEAGIVRKTFDYRIRELVPGVRTTFNGALFTVNRWGMRDRDYSLEPPPHTYRIALLGQSYVMGEGVADNETFETLIEERLNREVGPPAGKKQFEILNFGVAGYTPPQLLWLLENKALRFGPNVAVYIAYAEGADQSISYLTTLVRQRVPYPFPFLEDIVRRAGVTPEMPPEAVMRRLQGYRFELLTQVYDRFVKRCEAVGIIPVWFYLTPPDFKPDKANVETLERLAQRAGFEVFDLSNLYAGQDTAALRVAPWDRHPNAKGHRLIADRLYVLLSQRKDLLGL